MRGRESVQPTGRSDLSGGPQCRRGFWKRLGDWGTLVAGPDRQASRDGHREGGRTCSSRAAAPNAGDGTTDCSVLGLLGCL